MRKSKSIRVGIVGMRRGSYYGNLLPLVGMEWCAVCDMNPDVIPFAEKLGIQGFTDLDPFLSSPIDAVILANYFHEHAPLAIRCLNAGKHVLSETTACKTLAEGVALAEAVEKSGHVYLFGENYIYFSFIQEMRRLYLQNEIGEVRYAEGEYIHPMSSQELNTYSPGLNHWRNHFPSTYYCTHALGPVMYVTETMPVSVNAQTITTSRQETQINHVRVADPAAVILLRMDNGACVTLNGVFLRGHSIWYRFHGTRGLMENGRVHGTQMNVRIAHEPFDFEPGDVTEKIYTPGFPAGYQVPEGVGHGGGDFFIIHHFREAIQKQQEPWLNVYRGLAMSAVGIQAWKSCLEDGKSFEIPDFRNPLVRDKYRNEHWSPFPEDRGPGQPPPSLEGWLKPSRAQIQAAMKDWRKIGYQVTGKKHL